MGPATEKNASFPFGKALETGMPDWAKPLRKKAWELFQAMGFPDAKQEAWRNTSLDALLRASFTWGSEEGPDAGLSDLLSPFDPGKAPLLTFVNGRFRKDLSNLGALPKGVVLVSMLEADKDGMELFGTVCAPEGRAFVALNAAYFTDGYFLEVPKGSTVTVPLQVLYLTTGKGTQTHVRNLIRMGTDSSALIVEHYLAEQQGAGFTGVVTEAKLARGSALEHVKVQRESGKAIHLGTFAAKQEEGSRLTSRTFSFGGSLARNEVESSLVGPHAECVLEGLALANGRQHQDIRTFVDHAVPSCASSQTFRSVVDGEAVSVFDGQVLVRENAQKTDARQSNKNLQLSKESKVYSKPQLRIYADDVKCSHGSATGQLDEEALFYFQSRGIGREEAKRTLVYAFAGEMVERVPSEALRTPLKAMVNEWMAAGRNVSK